MKGNCDGLSTLQGHMRGIIWYGRNHYPNATLIFYEKSAPWKSTFLPSELKIIL